MVVPKGITLATNMGGLPVKQAGYMEQNGQQPTNFTGYSGYPNGYYQNGYYQKGYYPYGYYPYGNFNPYGGYRNPNAGGGDVIYAEIRDNQPDQGVKQAQFTRPSPGGYPYTPYPTYGAYG